MTIHLTNALDDRQNPNANNRRAGPCVF